ncbi:MAG: Slp family lipoprotein [Thiotrichales bacterium]
MLRVAMGLLAIALVSGCASNVPKPIETPIDPPIQLAEVRKAPATYIGKQVRWGGNIATVTNLAETTRVEIVSRRLQSSGRPSRSDHTDGRFVVLVPEFLDPSVYAKDRQLTVVGEIVGTEPGKIGEFDYQYPVVKGDTLHLWEPIREADWRDYPPYPGWYSPWYAPYRYRYDPFYPWWW